MMMSDVCLTSVAYIGPKSKTERSRKTKIGTEVAHVTRDSDTTFKVKGQRSRSWGASRLQLVLHRVRVYPAQFPFSALTLLVGDRL